MKNRAYELDLLRGLAIVMMMLHHLIFDLRYIFSVNAFAFQEDYIFRYWIRAPFLFIFLFVSGVACSFSRNNFKRAGRMAIVSIVFSLLMASYSIIAAEEMYVFFNIIQLLTVGTFIYALLEYFYLKGKIKSLSLSLLLISIVTIWMTYPFAHIDESQLFKSLMEDPGLHFLLPVHEVFSVSFPLGMADYLPMIPWIGIFFAGALTGVLFYSEKQSRLPQPSPALNRLFAPVEFVGRKSLYFYILHQPVIIGILYLVSLTGLL